VTTQAARLEPRAPARERPASLTDLIAWAAAIVALLIYSQAWLVPVFGETIEAADSSLVRTLYVPAYAIGLALLALKPAASLRGLGGQPFLVVLLGIAAASVLWSVSPDQTLRRSIAVTLTTVGGVAIGARWRWSGLTETVGATFAVLLVGSLIAGVFFPAVGRMATTFPGSWRGLWLEKNTFGGEMAFALLIFAAAGVLKPQRRVLWFALAVAAFGLTIASTSKTSLVALMLGLAVFALALVVRRGGSMAVIAIYAAVVGLLGLGAGILFAPDVFLDLLGKDATLTGRTKIWAAVLRQIQERPWLGYGYGAVWSEDTGWGPLAWIVKQAGFRPEHSHNSWLEQWLGMGYWGLGAWSLYYLTTLARGIGAMFRSDGALVALPFIAVYTVMTLTESVAVSYNDLRWVIFVAFSIRLALRDEAAG